MTSWLAFIAPTHYTPTPELLKLTDTRTHVSAKFSRICAKFYLLNAELENKALFHIFVTI